MDFEKGFVVEKPKYNDKIPGILFILVFLGFAAVSGISLNAYLQTNQGGTFDSSYLTLDRSTIVLFGFVLASALVTSLIYYFIAYKFTKQLIWITMIMHVIFGIGTGVWYIYRKSYVPGIFVLVFTVFYIFCFITWIPRIPFATLIFRTVLDVSRAHPQVYIVSLFGTILSLAFAAWGSVTLVAAYQKYHPDAQACNSTGGVCTSAALGGVLAFLTFSIYWVTEFIKNAVHTTICGIYGSWYYYTNSPAGFPKHAALSAARRTLTYSFGSVAFGSLIVSIIQTLRTAINTLRNQQTGFDYLDVILYILGCFVGLLEWLVQLFNHYAYTEIALFGKPYIRAAKDTWTLIKQKGIDAIINDCLIDQVLTAGSLTIAYITALLCFLYLYFLEPSYNSGGGYYTPVMAVGFLLGLQIGNTILVGLKSGTATLFVGLAVNPEVAQRQQPQLYNAVAQVYPNVFNPVYNNA